jgi:Carbohydrate-selective porin, OprB family
LAVHLKTTKKSLLEEKHRMSKVFRQLLLALPAAYAASLFAAAGALATPVAQPQAADTAADLGASARLEITAASTNFDASAQSADLAVPAVAPVVANSAIDTAATIQPTDWQYDALRGVQSKYDCNSATLNGQPVSRDSFAAGLNTCLKNVEPLMARTPSTVSAQEMEVLRRLTQDFRAELSNIETRIDKIQQRTALAQTSQFSTTTKLKGEVIVGLNGVISNGGTNGANATLSNRARLLFESTFTGKDRLYTRLTAQNGGGYGDYRGSLGGANVSVPFGTEGSQTYTGGGANGVSLDWLAYQFPVGNTSVYAAAFNGIHSDYADTHSPYFQDYSGGNGAISLLAEESPIYKIGGGAGIGVTIPLSSPGNTLFDSFNLSYFAGNGGFGAANNPAKDNGVFNGRNSILAQVNFKPSDKFDFGLTYVHGEHKGGAIYDWGSGSGVVGSGFANAGIPGVALGYNNSNSFGLSASYKASENLNLNGFVALTSANGSAGATNFNADILSYGVGAALPNVGQPGNLLGLFVGQSPSVTNVNSIANKLGIAGTPLSSNSFHIEGFYKYKLNDNISITPGLIYLTNPNQVKDSGSLIGTVRTTFTF